MLYTESFYLVACGLMGVSLHQPEQGPTDVRHCEGLQLQITIVVCTTKSGKLLGSSNDTMGYEIKYINSPFGIICLDLCSLICKHSLIYDPDLAACH